MFFKLVKIGILKIKIGLPSYSSTVYCQGRWGLRCMSYLTRLWTSLQKALHRLRRITETYRFQLYCWKPKLGKPKASENLVLGNLVVILLVEKRTMYIGSMDKERFSCSGVKPDIKCEVDRKGQTVGSN